MSTVTSNPDSGTFLQRDDSYSAKLKDPRWRARKNEIIERDRHRCMICGSSENLEVHHRQYHIITPTGSYREPWDYDDKLLVTLCHQCHMAGHNQYKVPVFFTEP